MTGKTQSIVAVGVVRRSQNNGGGGGGGDIMAADIINQSFTYNGINNVFALAVAARKVLNVFIDNGTYPDQVPAGATASVAVDGGLLLSGNIVTIQYIK